MDGYDLNTFERQVSLVRRQLDTRTGQAMAIVNRAREVKAEIAELQPLVHDLEQVTILLNSLGEERQDAAQRRIEELVTRGLQTIFDDTLSFHIVQTIRGKRAEAEFRVRTHYSDGTLLDTPVLESRGGGVAATVGFLLRLVVMLLRTGTTEQNILILDETFSMVSAEYLEPLGEFLREIVEKTGVQIVLVTHQPEFAEYADKVYRFSQNDGKTVVTENA